MDIHNHRDQIIAEVDATGKTIREYFWLDEMPVGVLDGSVNPATPTLLYVHPDHLNRPVLMTNAAKAVVWRASYEPFGAVHQITGPAANDNRFPGQLFQLESGLAYNWHRHYDASTGRYTQADPLGLTAMLSDGPSVYGYVGQSPLMKIDPTGQIAPLVVGAAVFGAYLFTPGNANAPGPGDVIVPNNDDAPFSNAAIAASTGAGACYGPLFRQGGLLNSNRYLRVGEGRAPGNKKVFRAAGEWVQKTTGKDHIDFKNLGPWSR